MNTAGQNIIASTDLPGTDAAHLRIHKHSRTKFRLFRIQNIHFCIRAFHLISQEFRHGDHAESSSLQILLCPFKELVFCYFPTFHMCCPDQGSGIFDQFSRNLHIKHDCQIHPGNPWNCLQKFFILISGDQATIDSFFHLLIIQKHLEITSLMQHAVPLDLQNHRCQRTQILLCHIFPEIMIHVHRRLLPVSFHHTGKSIQLYSIIFQHLYPFDRLLFSSLHKNSLFKPT